MVFSRRHTSRQRGNSCNYYFIYDKKETFADYIQISLRGILHDKKESFINWRRLDGERERNTNSAACLRVHLYADDRGGGRCTDGRTLSEGRRQSSSTETLRARRTTETTRSFTLDTDSRR